MAHLIRSVKLKQKQKARSNQHSIALSVNPEGEHMTEKENSSPFIVLFEQLEKGRFDYKEAQFFFKIGLAVRNKEITLTKKEN